jgi:integrase
MITPKFYLKDANSDVPTPIMLSIKSQGKVFRYSIQEKVLPDLWDKSTQRPTKNKNTLKGYKKELSNIKIELANLHTHIENFSRDASLIINQLKSKNGVLDYSMLKEELNKIYSTKISENVEPTDEVTLNQYIKKFVDNIESGKRLIKTGKNEGKVYAKSTVKTFKEWKVQWDNFQMDYINRQLNWNDITDTICDDFISFFSERDNSMNTIGKHIKNLKTILSYSFIEKFHENKSFENFPVYKTDITRVVLSENELELLEKKEFKNKETREDVDIFLIGCYTALRFSDYSRISIDHIKNIEGKNQIHIITKKTKEKVIIPISVKLNKILTKYNFRIPQTYAQRLNKNIKDACEDVGINETIEVKKVKGGRDIIEFIPKYKLVQSHTARRTGATNMYKNGMSTLLLMELTGHKKESTFLKYIVLAKEETAAKLAENKFFQ